MNSLVSIRRARGVLMALAAATGIFWMVGCGSSSPSPVQRGFSNSSLSGTYVFSSTGSDSNGNFLAIAGALVANGSGRITGGTMDVIDAAGTPASPVAQAITSGSYSVGVDGRGQARVTSSVATITLDFVLSSSSHGLVTEFDSNGTGSGTIDLQTAVTSLSQLAGPYAFSLGGIDSNGNSLATAGAFALDSSGAMTGGVEDFNDAGIPYTGESVTGAATLGSGTVPGAITLTTNFGQLTFDFYPIDSSHFKLIETDFTTAILAGDVLTQTGASIPRGPLVFTMAGGISAPIANGGLMTSDGQGTFTGGLEDVNDAGTVSTAQVPFTGSPSTGPVGFGGRVIVNLSGFVPATQWVIYPSSGGLLILETDSTSVTLGAAYAQTSTTLAASQGYGFNLSASNARGFEEDDIAEFTTTSTSLSGIVDLNDQGTTFFDKSLSGSYTAPSSGRGTTTTNDFNYTFYVVSNSTFLLLETDTNQVGLGTFELQNQPSAAAQHPMVSMIRRAGRSHGALRSK